MWDNYKSMPLILKLLTAHAFVCVMFVVGSIVPHGGFSINGNEVTYAEWWSSGAGISASIGGMIFPLVGYAMVTKAKNARLYYIGAWLVMLLAPIAIMSDFGLRLDVMLFVLAISAYLYQRAPVNEYFAASNK